MTPNGHTPGDLVERYLALRAKVEELEEAHSQVLKPYKAAMTAIEGRCAEIMRETKQVALKTEAGTAYTSTLFSAKVADRQPFLDFVLEHRLLQLLTAHVSKEAVKEYMELNSGRLPPGVETTTIQRVNFRRS